MQRQKATQNRAKKNHENPANVNVYLKLGTCLAC